MIDFVWQYKHSLSAWEELRYSIRSVVKNFYGSEYRLWIIGDKPPYLNNEINHIPHKRADGVYRTNCFDACSKMEVILNNTEISDRFILMYDDIYFTNPVCVDDLDKPFYMYKFDEWNPTTFSKHTMLLMDSDKALRDNGIQTTYQAETHMPRVFEKAKMQEIFRVYNPKNRRLVMATLYLNHFLGSKEPLCVWKQKNLIAYFYGFVDKSNHYMGISDEETSQVFDNYLLVNNNNGGLTKALIGQLQSRFKEKTVYEH